MTISGRILLSFLTSCLLVHCLALSSNLRGSADCASTTYHTSLRLHPIPISTSVMLVLHQQDISWESNTVCPARSPSLYLLTYGTEPFLRSCQLYSYSGTSQHFKEPECSSSCSQEPSTGPYPAPNRSSPYHPILSL
jgi:hypothetical protein